MKLEIYEPNKNDLRKREPLKPLECLAHFMVQVWKFIFLKIAGEI